MKNRNRILAIAVIILAITSVISGAFYDNRSCRLSPQTIRNFQVEAEWASAHPDEFIAIHGKDALDREIRETCIPDQSMAIDYTDTQLLMMYEGGAVSVEGIAMVYSCDPNRHAELSEVAHQSPNLQTYLNKYSKYATSSNDSNSASEGVVSAESVQEVKKEDADLSTVEIDESIKETLVAINQINVYSTYDDSKYIGSISAGDELKVTGKSSNNYYRIIFSDTDSFIKCDDSTVSKDAYESAWEESLNEEPNCVEKGFITYTNNLSGIEKVEEIAELGHTEGKWVTVNEPKFFSQGKEELRCEVCNELMDSNIIPQMIKWWMIVIFVLLCIGVATTIFMIKRSSAKNVTPQKLG